MESLIIEGKRTLCGRVRISGSKNISLPLIAASLLTEEPVVIEDAALAAKGKTEIQEPHHLDRGYEDMELKINNLGGNIYRTKHERVLDIDRRIMNSQG